MGYKYIVTLYDERDYGMWVKSFHTLDDAFLFIRATIVCWWVKRVEIEPLD